MGKKWTKAYKGFKKDMTCNGFKYPESGEVHVHDDPILCVRGVHACEAPLDCFRYYDPASSVYHEVKIAGSTGEYKDDSKICGTDVRIGARLDISGIVKAQIEYVKSHCTNENNAKKGKPATAGEYGAATAGDSGAATAGARGAATAGEFGAATAGARGAATAGEYGAATAGEFGAATAGDSGAATSRGKSSVGKNGAAIARGNDVLVRGGMGAIIVAVEENRNDYDIKSWCAGVVDGKTLQPDTWYRCQNGEFVEADGEKVGDT